MGVTRSFLRLFPTIINAALMYQGISPVNSLGYAGYGVKKTYREGEGEKELERGCSVTSRKTGS